MTYPDKGAIPFNGYPLDRADELRKDPATVEALWARSDARVLVLWRGRPYGEETADRWAPRAVSPSALPEGAVGRLFLGLDDDGVPTLAVALDSAREPMGLERDAFADLRLVAGRMSLPDAAVVGAARSVFEWHRLHGFCARCGAATEAVDAGWKRHCSACDREHFPRVDPVVIALITHGDAVLLGRGPQWPARFFSCLAGFVEPGETLGDATRREAWEEAKVRVGDVSYLFSQPWPFPSSLMLGVRGEAEDVAIEVDGVELAEARWFSRDEITQMMRGQHPDASPPFPVAVAHHLLRWWLDRGA